MQLRILLSSTLSIILLTGFTGSKKAEFAIESVKGLFAAAQEIKTLSYEFVREERIDDEIVTNTSFVKMQRRPYKIYIQETYPNEGLEVLYPHPQYEGKALINPNGFPWINLKLDPTSLLMRRGQHHTVLDGGFDYIVSVMEYAFYKHKSALDQIISYDGMTLFDGRPCDMITLSNPDFSYVNYTVSKGESITSIATKYRLNEYLIMDKNPGLDLASTLQAGQVIKLPSDYAERIVVYIDRDRQIPLMMRVFDEKGLFEKYEFKNVKINPELSASEFTTTFSGYNFN